MMFRRIQFSLLAFVLVSPLAAQAQRVVAPERSIPPEQVSSAIVKLQRDNANLKLTISELRDQNARLLGEVEALGFQLGAIRDEADRQARDDKTLSEDIDQLKELVRLLEDNLNQTKRQVQANSGFAGVASIGLIDQSVVELSTRPLDIQANPPNGRVYGSEQQQTASALSGFTTSDKLDVTEITGTADELLQQGQQGLVVYDLPTAEAAFRTFIDTYEDDERLPDAYYWLAEVRYQQAEHADAGDLYGEFLEAYPDHSNAPDALWKLARSMRLIDNQELACAFLEAMPARYPDAPVVTKNYAARERVLSQCE